MIQVEYDNGSIHTYKDKFETELAIEQAHADGLGVDTVLQDGDEDKPLSCLWSVVLQKEY